MPIDGVEIRNDTGELIARYRDDQRVRTDDTARILSTLLGVDVQPKTVANWRARGIGPQVEYFGTTPVYRVAELRRWATHDALKPKSVRRRNREASAGAAA